MECPEPAGRAEPTNLVEAHAHEQETMRIPWKEGILKVAVLAQRVTTIAVLCFLETGGLQHIRGCCLASAAHQTIFDLPKRSEISALNIMLENMATEKKC